ncbi:sigma-O factor regulator RsoA [Priestia megaterium]|uniref:Sigma-O factor regulator RsoA n=1 Tax=Priestia megaterium TaxID=1404 RepID=A0AAX6BTE5_PRIMG|nr:helix-turn-helix domain-containing protein [Priestia megaterium]GMG77005.1 sigma-O factor regulator RsoA [Priestia megaterium]
MDKNLYQLAYKAKEDNEAVNKIIEMFRPKIKKTLLQTDFQNREDLEQELQLKLVKVIKMYDLEGIMGFWEFHEMIKRKIS